MPCWPSLGEQRFASYSYIARYVSKWQCILAVDSGDLSKAAFHMEIFHQLTSKYKWHTDSGDSFHEIACEHLRRIYTSIAEEVRKP